jgi:hypothetical protein
LLRYFYAQWPFIDTSALRLVAPLAQLFVDERPLLSVSPPSPRLDLHSRMMHQGATDEPVFRLIAILLAGWSPIQHIFIIESYTIDKVAGWSPIQHIFKIESYTFDKVDLGELFREKLRMFHNSD